MTDILSSFQSGGAGPALAFHSMGEEDNLFHKGALYSQYQQRWNKFTPHHSAMVVQTPTTNGAGANLEYVISKSPDYYTTTYSVAVWKGIKANTNSNVTETSYVNGRGFFAIGNAEIRVSNQMIHTTSGLIAFTLADLRGDLDTYGKYAGLHKTKSQLIAASKRDSVTYTLMLGYSFSNPRATDQAWSVGGVAWHPVTMKQSSKNIEQLFVNHGSIGNSRGTLAIPIQVSSGIPINKESVQFHLATNSVWAGAKERKQLADGVNESVYKEYQQNPTKIKPASTSGGRYDVDLDFRGPVAFIAVTIRSEADLSAGNWTKDCNDQGGHYISDGVIITNNTPYSDGMPADFHAGPVVAEAFGSTPLRHTYLFSFETDSMSKQMNGHLPTTNLDKLKFAANYFPHSSDLQIDVIAAIYNGWFTKLGSCSRVWQ